MVNMSELRKYGDHIANLSHSYHNRNSHTRLYHVYKKHKFRHNARQNNKSWLLRSGTWGSATYINPKAVVNTAESIKFIKQIRDPIWFYGRQQIVERRQMVA